MNELAILDYCNNLIARLERKIDNEPAGSSLYIDGVLWAYRDIAGMLTQHINMQLEDMEQSTFEVLEDLEPLTQEQLNELIKRAEQNDR